MAKTLVRPPPLIRSFAYAFKIDYKPNARILSITKSVIQRAIEWLSTSHFRPSLKIKPLNGSLQPEHDKNSKNNYPNAMQLGNYYCNNKLLLFMNNNKIIL